jgi:ubiquinone/menaquinone biosynthesis C-methylase UbiE
MYSHSIKKWDKEAESVGTEMKRCQFDTSNPLILDVGCSIGRYEKILGEKGYHIIGFDVSSSALLEAHQNVPQADFVAADVMQLPFPNQRFDVVLGVEILHHFTDTLLERVLDEITRVIKPQGYLFFDIKNRLNPVLSRAYRRQDSVSITLKARTLKSLQRSLSKRGFRIISQKGLFFPIANLAPFIMVVARKEPAR